MIELRTFGSCEIRSSGSPGPRLPAKRLGLLAYLAAATPRGFHRRDELLAIFWPDLDKRHARGALREALSFLRRTLRDGVIVTRGDEEVGVEPSHITCDAVEFDTAVERGELERAVALYAGPFLNALHVTGSVEFDQWASTERGRLAQRYAQALEGLATQAELHGEHHDALRWWRRLAEHDPTSGHVAARLILTLDTVGNRGEALRHAERHTELMQTEFGTGPSQEFLAAAARLRQPPARVPPTPVPDTSQEAADVGVVPTGDREPTTDRRWQRAVIGGAAGVLVLAALVGAWLIMGRGRVGAPQDTRIAIIPFDNLGTADDEYFADGVTQEIAVRLAPLGGVSVIARRRADTVSARTPGEIGRTLGAQYVLTGSVAWERAATAEPRVRITAQLVQTDNDTYVWADRYTAPLASGAIFDVQEDVASRVAHALRVTLPQPSRRAEIARAPPNFAAYNAYLLGRYHMGRRSLEGFNQAIGYFNEALRADAGYAAAHAGLADAYALLGAHALVPPEAAYPRAKQAVQLALELDSTIAGAYVALAFVHLAYDWDLAAAESAFRRGLELDPAYAQAYHWFAWYWMARGEFDSAIVAMKQARTYDPLSLVITAQSGMPHFYARDFDAAIEYPRAALTLNPHSASGHWELGRARWGKGEYDLGAAALEETVNLAPNPIALAELGLVYGLAGRASEARDVLSQIQALSREQYIPAISNAWVHIGLGENDVALEWLERAYDERYIFLHFLPYDRRYDTIRSLPEFEHLLRRVQWTREQAASAPAF